MYKNVINSCIATGTIIMATEITQILQHLLDIKADVATVKTQTTALARDLDNLSEANSKVDVRVITLESNLKSVKFLGTCVIGCGLFLSWLNGFFK